MLLDLITALAAAPLWAQVALVLFAVAVVVSIAGPGRDYRRHRTRFEGLARDLGATAKPGREKWPVSFSTVVDGRAFDVRYDYRSTGRSSYRGPGGHLLISTTPLAGSRWELHQVDIAPGRARRLIGGGVTTGDAAFDARFSLREDGVPVREGWLDADTRAAVTAFYDTTAASGPVWVQEQQLQHIASAPWQDIDGPALRALLQGQAALATAFERTAGWRRPVS